MGEPTVREARVDDVSAVARVAERGWRAAYGDCLSRETIDEALGTWYDPSTLRGRIEREEGLFVVGERDGEVVGYASGAPDDGRTVATLGAIYVDPDWWGMGVGGALLEAFESWCRRHGYRTIRFRVVAGNDRAASFYRSRGYEAVDEVDAELFGEPITELVFQGEVGNTG